MTSKQKGIIAMLISAFGFSMMGVFIKLTGDIPVFQKVVFRTFIILIVSTVMMHMQKVPFRSIKHHKLLLLRSLLGTFGILLNFYAVDTLLLSDANVLFRLSTILLIIFCWIFLGEHITLDQFTSIVIAFIGVMFVMKPQFSVEIIPYIAAVLGATFAAAAYTTVRALGPREHPLSVVFYFSAFSTVVLFPYLIFNYVPMSGLQVFYATMAGLSAAVGQIGVTVGYKLAPAREISIYNYFGVVFSAFLSVFIFNAMPDALSIVGYLIIFGTSYHMYRKNMAMNKSVV